MIITTIYHTQYQVVGGGGQILNFRHRDGVGGCFEKKMQLSIMILSCVVFFKFWKNKLVPDTILRGHLLILRKPLSILVL